MPSTMKQWTVVREGSGFDQLKFNEKAAVPELGDRDVLVKCEANCDSTNASYLAKQQQSMPLH